ncbi:DUF3181 family protein [Leptolyngbya sp. FACHB-261]|uniref:DUF3181 family protein n=1 Tax=Leptolyngbya sp. FACHB-261 TaxID=2692806 RepID=UPI001684637B|nr:DUF3181 family protein [Leptolyngbya sp. FACHB-261]MBD2101596.1 DUF3181 family protein [Leptolyngbya sp. FACHB-261]
MASSNLAPRIELLAAEIGDRVYMDIAKWHLQLNNAHLHKPLAERLYPLIADGKVPTEDQVNRILGEIPVKIGGGRHEVPLLNLLPMQGLVSLMDVLEEFARRKDW